MVKSNKDPMAEVGKVYRIQSNSAKIALVATVIGLGANYIGGCDDSDDANRQVSAYQADVFSSDAGPLVRINDALYQFESARKASSGDGFNAAIDSTIKTLWGERIPAAVMQTQERDGIVHKGDQLYNLVPADVNLLGDVVFTHEDRITAHDRRSHVMRQEGSGQEYTLEQISK